MRKDNLRESRAAKISPQAPLMDRKTLYILLKIMSSDTEVIVQLDAESNESIENVSTLWITNYFYCDKDYCEKCGEKILDYHIYKYSIAEDPGLHPERPPGDQVHELAHERYRYHFECWPKSFTISNYSPHNNFFPGLFGMKIE